MEKDNIFSMDEKYEEYLMDESKYRGNADSISFPENEDEIIHILKDMVILNKPITIQGGKTGIVGSGVPNGGHIMNLSKMNHVKDSKFLDDGTCLLTVEPGINLIDLRKEINKIPSKVPLFWPPNPTETSATIGGIAATGANGIYEYLYGDTKKYINSVKLLGYDEIQVINKDMRYYDADGRKLDLLDMILGREGITGIFSEITLTLIPKPESIWGISFFFEKDEDAGIFINKVNLKDYNIEQAEIAAIEYMDRATIDLIEDRKANMTKIKELPDIEEQFVSMVYLELHGSEEGVEGLAGVLMEMAIDANSDPDKAWAVSGDMEIEKMHSFRHAAAETTNLYIEELRRNDKRITKLGTDMSVENSNFYNITNQYRSDAREHGLECCIFGHGYNNHVHVNLFPKTYEEYLIGIRLIRKWAKEVQSLGGKIACEHGIGKLKKELLSDFIPEDYISICDALKKEFDPKNIFNQGNII